MPKFDKNKILEEILKEVPIKLNLRGEVVIGTRKRVIYAFYQNIGVPDPELKYDREKNPIATTPDSTICEVYSAGGPWNKERTKEHLENIKTNERYARIEEKSAEKFGRSVDIFVQGPDGGGDETTPAENARNNFSYDFSTQSKCFVKHFNQLCERLGYDVRLVDAAYVRYYVETPREVEIVENEKRIPTTVNMRLPIGIDLRSEDPTLNDVLAAIEKNYLRLKKASIVSSGRDSKLIYVLK